MNKVTATVYHNLGSTTQPNKTIGSLRFIDYVRVAYVEVPLYDDINKTLSAVFEMTNSVDMHWSEHEGVVALRPHCRSTSVGDVIRINNVKYIVVNNGFEKL